MVNDGYLWLTKQRFSIFSRIAWTTHVAFTLVLLIVACDSAHAETHGAESLEWMTVDSELIVRGKVIGRHYTKHPREDPKQPHTKCPGFLDITVAVSETLKGVAKAKFIKFRTSQYKNLEDSQRFRKVN